MPKKKRVSRGGTKKKTRSQSRDMLLIMLGGLAIVAMVVIVTR